MDLGIAGKRAAVAASSAGLGLACAEALAAAGAKVAVSGRDQARLTAAAEQLGATRGDVVAVPADVSTPDGARAFVGDCAAALGGDVEILVANAGGPPPGTFATTSIEDYRRAIDGNLLSTVAMCQAAVPAMTEAGWGRVVAITSIGARQPIPSLMASVTARTGLTGFLKVLATEVASTGVTVNSVQPGLHRTARLTSLHGDDLSALAAEVPTRTIGDPKGFGELVAFLCSVHAAFITGTAIPVDGGATRALP
jgi:3-oxoacyl-[acyl-carrier protein] reductase